MLEDLALKSIRKIAQRVGPAMALKGLHPLLETLPLGPTRAEAVALGISYSIQAGNNVSLTQTCRQWARLGAHARTAMVFEAIHQAHTRREYDRATAIAQSECQRARGTPDEGLAHYVHGRCQEAQSQPERASHAYRRTIEITQSGPLHTAAQLRDLRVRCLFKSMIEIAEEAAALTWPEALAPHDQLFVATLKLYTPGRYLRLAGLDTLETLVQQNRYATQAMAQTLAHAERMGESLSAIEANRIASILQKHPDAIQRRLACEQLRACTAIDPESGHGTLAACLTQERSARHLPMARAALNQDDIQATAADATTALESDDHRVLQVYTALTGGDVPSSLHLLEQMRPSPQGGIRAQPPYWRVLLELGSRSEIDNKKLARLATSLFDSHGAPPTRGYLPVAEMLHWRGITRESIRAAERAFVRKEPNAKEFLGGLYRDQAWKTFQQGAHSQARAYLHRARARLKR